MGAAVSGPHNKTDSANTWEASEHVMDCMYMTEKIENKTGDVENNEDGKGTGAPALAAKGQHSDTAPASIDPIKGCNAYAVTRTCANTNRRGHKRVVNESDQTLRGGTERRD